MYRCKICSNTSSQYTTVCSRCNGTEIEQVPDDTYTPPRYSHSYTESTYYGTVIHNAPYPKSAFGGKIQGIISMILGIEAICSSILCVLFSVALDELTSFYDTFYDYPSYYGMNDMISSLLSIWISGIACAIVSLCLASVAKNKGNTGKMPNIGRILSFISIGMCGIGALLFISQLN